MRLSPVTRDRVLIQVVIILGTVALALSVSRRLVFLATAQLRAFRVRGGRRESGT